MKIIINAKNLEVSVKDMVEIMALNYLPMDLCSFSSEEGRVVLTVDKNYTGKFVLPRKFEQKSSDFVIV